MFHRYPSLSFAFSSLQVAEPDEVWQYDVLFAEVKAELSNEEEGADVSKEGECGL